MTRRQYLAGISALAAHALFSEVLESFARAAAAPPEAWRPEAVAADQGPLLAEVVETILPETDTPGAKAARVHVFVDLALARCAPRGARCRAVSAAIALAPAFLAATPDARRARRALDAGGARAAAGADGPRLLHAPRSARRRRWPTTGPGGYRGCIDLKPGQKAWAT